MAKIKSFVTTSRVLGTGLTAVYGSLVVLNGVAAVRNIKGAASAAVEGEYLSAAASAATATLNAAMAAVLTLCAKDAALETYHDTF